MWKSIQVITYYSDILFYMFSCLYSDILSFSPDILCLAYLLDILFLPLYLVYLWKLFVLEVLRGTLQSGAWAWNSGGKHFDPELVAEVRRGTL